MSAQMKSHQSATGTICDLTVYNFPQLNGIAEHANQTIVEGACTMMIAAGLPKYLWAEAKHHIVWLRNRTPTSSLPNNTTPYQMVIGKKPDLLKVCKWGSHTYVKLHHTGKLESQVMEVRMVGIDDESKGYQIYWPNRNRITVERDIYFSKGAALNPDNIQIEGKQESANSDSPQTQTALVPSKDLPKSDQNELDKSKLIIQNTPTTENMHKNGAKHAATSPESSQDVTDECQVNHSPPTSAPHL
ncbi:Copia protein [Termitomyces sp. J132]|nr:Copia protein [Termitomyces sp. J132]